MVGWYHRLNGYTAAAKLLQSCLTLCNPIDRSPLGSPVPGILQARTLEWVAISFSNAGKWRVKGKSLSRVRLLATPWTAAYQASIHGIFQARVLECGAIAFSVLCPNSYKSYHSLFQYPHANNCKQVANKLNLQYQLLLAKGNTWSFSQLLTKFSWSAVGRFGKCGMWWLWQTFTSWAFAGVQGIAEESNEMGKRSEEILHY